MKTLPLWKRCRALATVLRIDMLQLLNNCPGCCVKEVASELNIAENIASKHLQILASAGWISKRPAGRYLYYTLDQGNVLLDEVLTYADEKSIDRLIFMITALTHERRILIVKALVIEPTGLESLCRKTRIPRLALRRHLDKLARRGFVQAEKGLWALAISGDGLKSKLIDSVSKEITPAQV